jgi:hypothetical protein
MPRSPQVRYRCAMDPIPWARDRHFADSCVAPSSIRLLRFKFSAIVPNRDAYAHYLHDQLQMRSLSLNLGARLDLGMGHLV